MALPREHRTVRQWLGRCLLTAAALCLILCCALDPGIARATGALNSGFLWEKVGTDDIPHGIPDFDGCQVPAGAVIDANGRVTAIALDPNVSGLMFVGTAGGGLWKSTDSGQTFSPVTLTTAANTATFAIGAITIDAKSGAIYVGTGEGNYSVDSYYGDGLYESTDNGNTWSKIGGTVFDHMSITKIAVDDATGNLFVGVTRGVSASRADANVLEGFPSATGLYLSKDGGATFAQYPASAFGGCTLNSGPCPADDLVVLPNPTGSANLIFAAIHDEGVFESADSGATWNPVLTTAQNGTSACGGTVACPNGIGRISLAGQNTQANGQNVPVVYAMIGYSDNLSYDGLFELDSSGVWEERTIPAWFDSCNGSVVVDGGSVGYGTTQDSQSFYDQAITIEPGNPSTLFFGGIGIYKSTDSGNTWNALFTSSATHADQHAIQIDPTSNTVYVGNDGGLFSFDQATGAFTASNDYFRVTQLQSIGPRPVLSNSACYWTDLNDALLGLQDNGTVLWAYGAGLVNPPPACTTAYSSTTQADLGDGGFALFDQADPTYAYHTYASVSGVPIVAASSDGGATWSDASSALDTTLTNNSDPGAVFYPPLAASPVTAQTVLFGAHHVYESTDGMNSWSKISGDLTGGCANGSCALQDIEFGPRLSDESANTIWAISSASTVHAKVWVSPDGGTTWNDITPPDIQNLPVQPTSIDPDPNHAGVAYVTVSGSSAVTGAHHIYKFSCSSPCSSGTWTAADGSGGSSPLPDTPTLTLLVDGTDPSGQTLLAGTDTGVFLSADGGSTWSNDDMGLIPTVPIFDIEQDNQGSIFVATHGSGAYRLAPPMKVIRAATDLVTASAPGDIMTASLSQDIPGGLPVIVSTAIGPTSPKVKISGSDLFGHESIVTDSQGASYNEGSGGTYSPDPSADGADAGVSKCVKVTGGYKCHYLINTDIHFREAFGNSPAPYIAGTDAIYVTPQVTVNGVAQDTAATAVISIAYTNLRDLTLIAEGVGSFPKPGSTVNSLPAQYMLAGTPPSWSGLYFAAFGADSAISNFTLVSPNVYPDFPPAVENDLSSGNTSASQGTQWLWLNTANNPYNEAPDAGCQPCLAASWTQSNSGAADAAAGIFLQGTTD